jgi:hypothetical protein
MARLAHHGRATDVGEACGQAVHHRGLARHGAGCHTHGDAVAHAVADLGRAAVTRLGQRNARGQGRVQRDVVVDDVGARRARGQRQEVAGGRAHVAGGRARLRLHGVDRARTARRHQRPRTGRDGGGLEAVARARRRCHRQAKGAGRGCRGPEQELIEAVGTHGHGHAPTVDGVAAQAAPTRPVAGSQAAHTPTGCSVTTAPGTGVRRPES